MNRIILSIVGLFAVFLFVGLSPHGAEANHAWGGYHWARTANPFTLQLGNNLSGNWVPLSATYLATASADWSTPTVTNPLTVDVIDTTVAVGGTNPKNCRPTAGRVEVCNANYGNNGWLGIAQIWVSSSHITQGVVKLNDTYFNTAKYTTSAWRQFVMCQEIGHTFGLDHQDVNFDNPNLDTCMDYTRLPESNQHPNAHDYEELALIYKHLDSTTTVGSSVQRAPATGDMNSPSEWGKLVSKSANGKAATFERDLGNGQKVLTHVYYAD